MSGYPIWSVVVVWFVVWTYEPITKQHIDTQLGNWFVHPDDKPHYNNMLDLFTKIFLPAVVGMIVILWIQRLLNKSKIPHPKVTTHLEFQK